MNVTILGTGYVGLTTAVALAYLGHEVSCVDVDERKIEALNAGRIPIYEPGLDLVLEAARSRIAFTTDPSTAISKAEVVFIAVGTPPLADGAPDLGQLQSAAKAIGQHLGESFTAVVNKSTVPIGSGNWVAAHVSDALAARGQGRGEGRFAVASNPEFLREGSAVHDTLYADRIVVGCDDDRAREVLFELYRAIVEQTFTPPACAPRPAGLAKVPFVTTKLSSAELIKYSANAFLALKISFINELAELAEKVGGDIREVAAGVGLDQRIGPRFLQAGLGWGGSCFGKDTSALLATGREYGLNMPIVRAAREVNQNARERILAKLQQELKILNGRTIGLLGLAFKPETDDLRDAPALDLARRLIKRGARVRGFDPVAMPRARQEWSTESIDFCESPDAVADGADALVLVTEWSQFGQLDWPRLAARLRNRLVIDGRGVLDEGALTAAGVKLVPLGR